MLVITLSSDEEEDDCVILEEDEELMRKNTHRVFIVTDPTMEPGLLSDTEETVSDLNPSSPLPNDLTESSSQEQRIVGLDYSDEPAWEIVQTSYEADESNTIVNSPEIKREESSKSSMFENNSCSAVSVYPEHSIIQDQQECITGVSSQPLNHDSTQKNILEIDFEYLSSRIADIFNSQCSVKSRLGDSCAENNSGYPMQWELTDSNETYVNNTIVTPHDIKREEAPLSHFQQTHLFSLENNPCSTVSVDPEHLIIPDQQEYAADFCSPECFSNNVAESFNNSQYSLEHSAVTSNGKQNTDYPVQWKQRNSNETYENITIVSTPDITRQDSVPDIHQKDFTFENDLCNTVSVHPKLSKKKMSEIDLERLSIRIADILNKSQYSLECSVAKNRNCELNSKSLPQTKIIDLGNMPNVDKSILEVSEGKSGISSPATLRKKPGRKKGWRKSECRETVITSPPTTNYNKNNRKEDVRNSAEDSKNLKINLPSTRSKTGRMKGLNKSLEDTMVGVSIPTPILIKPRRKKGCRKSPKDTENITVNFSTTRCKKLERKPESEKSEVSENKTINLSIATRSKPQRNKVRRKSPESTENITVNFSTTTYSKLGRKSGVEKSEDSENVTINLPITTRSKPRRKKCKEKSSEVNENFTASLNKTRSSKHGKDKGRKNNHEDSKNIPTSLPTTMHSKLSKKKSCKEYLKINTAPVKEHLRPNCKILVGKLIDDSIDAMISSTPTMNDKFSWLEPSSVDAIAKSNLNSISTTSDDRLIAGHRQEVTIAEPLNLKIDKPDYTTVNVLNKTTRDGLYSIDQVRLHSIEQVRINFVKFYKAIFNEDTEFTCRQMGDWLLLAIGESRNLQYRIKKSQQITGVELKTYEVKLAMESFQKSWKRYSSKFIVLFSEIYKKVIASGVYDDIQKLIVIALFLKILLRDSSVVPEHSDYLQEARVNVASLLNNTILNCPLLNILLKEETYFKETCWLVLELMKTCLDENRSLKIQENSYEMDSNNYSCTLTLTQPNENETSQAVANDCHSHYSALLQNKGRSKNQGSELSVIVRDRTKVTAANGLCSNSSAVQQLDTYPVCYSNARPQSVIQYVPTHKTSDALSISEDHKTLTYLTEKELTEDFLDHERNAANHNLSGCLIQTKTTYSNVPTIEPSITNEQDIVDHNKNNKRRKKQQIKNSNKYQKTQILENLLSSKDTITTERPLMSTQNLVPSVPPEVYHYGSDYWYRVRNANHQPQTFHSQQQGSHHRSIPLHNRYKRDYKEENSLPEYPIYKRYPRHYTEENSQPTHPIDNRYPRRYTEDNSQPTHPLDNRYPRRYTEDNSQPTHPLDNRYLRHYTKESSRSTHPYYSYKHPSQYSIHQRYPPPSHQPYSSNFQDSSYKYPAHLSHYPSDISSNLATNNKSTPYLTYQEY